jgi:class 3 adenylate cyclase/tetratricopeptide (TPR) repeat protein
MMPCAKCNSDIPADALFCMKCGAKVEIRCTACGTINPSVANFCRRCGAPLGAAAPIHSSNDFAGERRHLTVLFCDLVGSTEIASHLDPEEWREIVGEYHRAATKAIECFGGSVAQYLGDGVMAYFGYPEAHDNDAERAARAGLAILEALSKLNEQPSRPKLSARIGIDSGAVVVGIGSGKDADVFGDTPNIAARVQAAAEPGSVVITEAAHRLVSGLFVVEERGGQALKGVKQSVRLYRVVQPSGVRGRLQAIAASHGLTPFVGREGELHLLMNRWGRALDGEGQVGLIIGEAGIGKSRLVQRFHEEIADTSHTWVEAAAGPFFQNTPFHPVTELLRESLAWRGDEDAEEQFVQLKAALELAGLKPGEALPLIAPLLNLPLTQKYRPSLLSPDQQRRRLLAALVEWVLGVSRVRPTIIVIEDLHWVDPSTLELIQLLGELGANVQLLLLYTARPEFRAQWPQRAHHTQITLKPLNPLDVRAIVNEITPSSALPEDTITAVVERTGGVPLFVEELTRSLLEAGKVEPQPHEIPATLHDSLMARLDRLGPAKEVAQFGSVIGREFPYGLLHAVHPAPEARLRVALEALTDAELLYVRGIPPEAVYGFRHALIEDAAYEALLKARRREIHRQVADVISQQFADLAEEQPEVVAHHYTEAGLAAEAVPHWLSAGKRMSLRSAHAEAIAHLTKGLGLLTTLPDGPERDQQELGLQMALGASLLATRGFGASETGQAYTRARELCRRLDETAQLFPVLAGLRFFHVGQGNLKTARDLGEEFLQRARDTGNRSLILEGHYAAAVPLHLLGEFVSAREHCERAIALYDPEEHRSHAFLYGLDAGVASRCISGMLLWELGYPERALEKSREALSLAREVAHSVSLANALATAGVTQMWCGQTQSAHECAEALIALAKENGFSAFAAMGSLLRGWALAAQARGDEGIAQILEGIAAWRATGARGNGTGHFAVLLAAYSLVGRTTKAGRSSSASCAITTPMAEGLGARSL